MGPDLAEPPHRGPVELHLVDRLAGADPAELRGPVGGQGDQRNRRLVGLRRSPGGSWPPRCRTCRGSRPGCRRPGRRRARSRRPSARRRSRSPRPPAGARARPRAGSSASRGRGRRSASRTAPAPRRRRTRARCWRCRVHQIPEPTRSVEPVCLQRGLVDIDAQPWPGRWVEHLAIELTTDRGDGLGEEALGRKPVGEVKAILAAGLAQRRRDLRRRRIPTGPSSALVT